MKHDIFDYLLSKLNEESRILTDDLARGGAKDFGDYRWSCGVLRGLALAALIISDTAKRLENDDD